MYTMLIILVVLNTALFGLAASYTLKLPPKPDTLGSRLFYGSAYLSQAFLFAVIVSAWGLVLAYMIKNPLAWVITNAICNFICLILSFINSVVLCKYRFSLTMDIIRLVFGKGGTEVVQPHPLEYLIFGSAFLIVMGITGLVQFFAWHLASHISVVVAAKYICFALALLYISNQIIFCVLSAKRSMSILQHTIKIYLYYGLSFCRFLKYLNIIKDDLYQTINKKSDLHYPLKSLSFSDEPSLNVMMIVIDSLRFDAITSENMPNVSNFSKNASNFTQHFSGGNTTQPGIFSIFYGIPATYWNATMKQKKPPVMIDSMQRKNYQLGIYGSATLENPAFHKNIFFSIKDLNTFTQGTNPLERDKSITKSMIRFISERDRAKPFFGFMFYDSPHGYYAIPNLPQHFQPTKQMNHITANNNTDPKPLKNQYFNAVYETDKLIASVLETLKSERLLESTIVMITSDHGQEFNDLKKNYWEHPNNFARFQTKVPMVIHHPHKLPEQHDGLTTHYDIVPTLMQDALGALNDVSDYCVGQNLYKQHDAPCIMMGNYTNYAVMTHEHIIEIQKSGYYQMMDHDMNYINTVKMDVNTRATLANQMLRFSKSDLSKKCSAAVVN